MNDPLHIALIEPVGGHGGMDYYDYGLAAALGRRGIKVIYCTSEETNPQVHENVTTHLLFKRVWSTKNKFVRLLRYITGLSRSIKQAKKAGCHIVHFQLFELSWLNFIVLMITRMKRMKIVVTLHDIESFHLRSSKLVDRLCAKRIDEMIVHNQICKELVLQKLNLPEIHVIPHGNYIGMVKECEELDPTKDKLNLLFFGQIKEVKGLDILLRALGRLKKDDIKVHLTIAGKPWKTELTKYQQLIQQLGITEMVTTNFHYIPNEKVHQYYEQADLVVLPYRRIYQSGVLLMSMSMGRPVIASDLDSFKEVIEDGRNGFLFDQENDESLALKLKAIMDRKEDLPKISANAMKDMMEHFNWDNIATQTEKVYFRLR